MKGRRKLVIAAVVLALGLAVVAAAQQTITYRVEMVFSLPSPTANEYRVVIADGLTDEEAALRQAVANKILFGIQGAYARQRPPRGWAPFSAGVHLAPSAQ